MKVRNLDTLQGYAILAGLAVLFAAVPARAWDAPVMLTGNASASSPIALEADGKGRTVAVWTYLELGERRLAASIKPVGGQFALPSDISGEDDVGTYDWDTEASKKGTVSVVWGADDGVDTRVSIADLGPKALQFSAGTPISPMGQDKKWPLVGIDKKGNTTVAWTNGNDIGLEVVERPAKGTFGSVQPVAADREIIQPRLAVGAGGHAVLAWRSDPSPDPNQIQASVRLPGSAFQPYQVVSDPMELSGNPYAAIDGKGNAIVAFDPARIANLTAGNALFDAPLPHNLRQVPTLRYDKKGNLYVFTTNWFSPSNEAVFTMRPAGSQTFEPETIFGQSGIEFYAGDIAVDKKGNVRLVWTQFDNMGGARVYTAYRAAGESFSLPEPLTSVSDYCTSPRVVIDKRGNATVVYFRANPDTMLTELWATSMPKP